MTRTPNRQPARVAAAVCLCALLETGLSAQAFCALRDPVRRIYAAFPEATSYRSIVRSITNDTRKKVAGKLPFTLHFNELGRHTLYVPTKGSTPLGLVHTRSESSAWGIVEIVWAMDLNLRVRGFSFQRCRSSGRRFLQTQTFQKQLIGKSAAQLRAMLDKDGSGLAPGRVRVAKKAEPLAAMAIRSALKAVWTTRFAWEQDLQVLRVLDHAYTAFPTANEVQKVSDVYSKAVRAAIQKQLDTDGGTAIEGETALLAKVLDKQKKVLGFVLRGTWKHLKQSTTIWWNVSADLRIVDVIVEGEWQSLEIEKAFRDTRGLTYGQLGRCSTAAEVVAAEVLVVSKFHGSAAAGRPAK